MDLKGPAYNAQTINAVAAAAQAGTSLFILLSMLSREQARACSVCGISLLHTPMATGGPAAKQGSGTGGSAAVPLATSSPGRPNRPPLLPPSPAAQVAAHVALFVSSAEQLGLVQQQTQWAGPLIRAYMVGPGTPHPALPQSGGRVFAGFEILKAALAQPAHVRLRLVHARTSAGVLDAILAVLLGSYGHVSEPPLTLLAPHSCCRIGRTPTLA